MNEEEINDMDVKALYDAMSNNWRNEKDEMELLKTKKTFIYKLKSFLSWFLDINTINYIDVEPTEIV